MPDCSICGEKIPDGSRTCSTCGSSADDFLPMATMLHATPPAHQPALEKSAGGRVCPRCSRTFDPDSTEAYCSCGAELAGSEAGSELPMAALLDDMPMAPFDGDALPMAPVLEDLPLAPLLDDGAAPPMANLVNEPHGPAKPEPGTPCLVLYGADKQPLRYFALTKDATTIGRLDAVKGSFPDIELDEWFDRTVIRRISRQHAVILRTRVSNTFALRPLVGNTGTQLETQMLEPMHDYPLRPGQRIILGGVIRLKFEVA